MLGKSFINIKVKFLQEFVRGKAKAVIYSGERQEVWHKAVREFLLQIMQTGEKFHLLTKSPHGPPSPAATSGKKQHSCILQDFQIETPLVKLLGICII